MQGFRLLQAAIFPASCAKAPYREIFAAMFRPAVPFSHSTQIEGEMLPHSGCRSLTWARHNGFRLVADAGPGERLPHSDSTRPLRPEILAEQTGRLTQQQADWILRDNIRELYKLN